MERTLRWARRARERFLRARPPVAGVSGPIRGQVQFGIVQGAPTRSCASESARHLAIGFEATPSAASASASRTTLMYEVVGTRRRSCRQTGLDI